MTNQESHCSFLQAVVDASPFMMWTDGPDRLRQWMNAAWLRFTGRSLEQERGTGWTQGVHKDDLAHLEHIYAERFAAREPFKLEYRLRRNDGEFRWILDSGVPRYAADGSFTGYVGGCIDIQPFKSLEGSLRRQAAAAAQMESRKDEFLGMLAHELRNPLAPIHAATQLLQMRSVEEPQRTAALGIIERQVRNLTRLVNDLLDVSRLMRGKIELKRQWMDLRQSVQEAVETTRPLYEEQSQRLALHLPQEPITLYADPVRIAQVVANLLDNAARYSPQGSAIDLHADRANGYAKLVVRDRGVGIAPALLATIWEPFVQLDAGPRHGHGGLGVGLALVRSLVRMHGGEASAASEGPGKGAEFSVKLPLGDPAG